MLPLDTIVLRLLWGGMLGAAIGVERSYRRRPAGMRTGFCVRMASALFTILSVEIAKSAGDTSATRIASNIVQGIGFLGAGAILRERGNVTGLTTAATIFASLGLVWFLVHEEFTRPAKGNSGRSVTAGLVALITRLTGPPG